MARSFVMRRFANVSVPGMQSQPVATMLISLTWRALGFAVLFAMTIVARPGTVAPRKAAIRSCGTRLSRR